MEPLKRGASGVSKPIINLNYEIFIFRYYKRLRNLFIVFF